MVLVAGFAETAGERIHNSAAVCDRGELLGVYRKVHLWGDEPDHFTAAADPPLVLDTSAGRIGVLICYDMEFPEWVRLAAEADAELIAVPVNSARCGRSLARGAVRRVGLQEAGTRTRVAPSAHAARHQAVRGYARPSGAASLGILWR